MTPRIHTTGNARPWITTPQQRTCGDRQHAYGKLQPMDEPRKWWQLKKRA